MVLVLFSLFYFVKPTGVVQKRFLNGDPCRSETQRQIVAKLQNLLHFIITYTVTVGSHTFFCLGLPRFIKGTVQQDLYVQFSLLFEPAWDIQ